MDLKHRGREAHLLAFLAAFSRSRWEPLRTRGARPQRPWRARMDCQAAGAGADARLTMRLFIFARHGESAANVGGVVSSDPAHGAGLTSRGRAQARRLGAQIANLEIDLAVCTRFLRTRETVDLALHGRTVPLLIEPDLDEINTGAFDGAPIRAYWAWREQHSSSDRFPGGESLEEAVRRYADGLQRLLARDETVTLIVAHEHVLRHVAEAAGRVRAGRAIANALPHFFDENAVRSATQCLYALAPSGAREGREVA